MDGFLSPRIYGLHPVCFLMILATGPIIYKYDCFFYPAILDGIDMGKLHAAIFAAIAGSKS